MRSYHDHDAIRILVGDIATSWSAVEAYWYLIFTTLMPETPTAQVEAIYFSFETNAAQRQLVMNVAAATFPDRNGRKNQELTFDNNVGEFQGNLLLAEQDAQLMRNAGGVTNENLGRNTAAQSGKAIGLKQDQGSLTTSELFDNLLLAIKQVGKLRLSHIEQFYTDSKAVRIIGDGKPIEWLQVNRMDPATGEIMNDVTAREADFVVDTQDWRSSLARSQMEELFQLLGQMATFAPNVVMVLDLVVDSTEIRDKAEWVARIRKLNGQRDPSKPLTEEEQKAEMRRCGSCDDRFLASERQTDGRWGDYRVSYSIDGGEPKFIDKWEPIWLSGWSAGKHSVKLELVDKDGKVVDNGGYNSTTREITVAK